MGSGNEADKDEADNLVPPLQLELRAAREEAKRRFMDHKRKQDDDDEDDDEEGGSACVLDKRKSPAPGTSGDGNAAPSVAITVGPPGSGKSTLATKIMAAAQGSWERVCQDVIGNRKVRHHGSALRQFLLVAPVLTPLSLSVSPLSFASRGLQGCVAEMKAALRLGKSVIVDRCHCSVRQREDFLRAAASFGAPCHAIVFELPLDELQLRVRKRRAHEGGVTGARGAAVCAKIVKQMRAPGGVPTPEEGFARVFRVRLFTEAADHAEVVAELAPTEAREGAEGIRGASPPASEVIDLT